MSIVDIKGSDHFKTAIAENKYAVVYVYTKWCPACQMMSPIFERAARTTEKFDGITFCKLDAGAEYEGTFIVDFQEEYGIEGYPQTVAFQDGAKFCSIVGFRPRRDFEEILEFYQTYNIPELKEGSVDSDPQEKDSYVPLKTFPWHEDVEKVTKLLGPTWTIFIFCFATAPYVPGFLKLASKRLGHYHEPTMRIRIIKLDSRVLENQDFIQTNLLEYRPYALIFRGEEQWSTYNFRMDEGDGVERWIGHAFNAANIMDSALPSRKSYVSDLDTLKGFKNKISSHKPIAVLFHDSTAYSQAMLQVFRSAADHRQTKFYIVDYGENDEFVDALNLEEGPSVAIYSKKHMLAETKTPMTLPELKDWLLQHITQLPTSPVSPLSNGDNSLLSPGSADGLARFSLSNPPQFDRPSSRMSDHSYVNSLLNSPEAPRSKNAFHERIQCQGGFEHREESSLLHRLLITPKPFQDQERGCVVISSSAREGMQFGRANEGGSYFNITLRPLAFADDLRIPFGVEFGPDRTEKARFTSASLSISFGFRDANGHAHHLKVKEISPKDVKGDSTIVHRGVGTEASLGLQVGYASASLSTEGRKKIDEQYSRATASHVTSSGQYSDTATWSFGEDEGPAGRHGLETSYDLEVTLISGGSTDIRDIRMTLWGTAVLVRGNGHGIGSKQTLKIGSREQPFERILDLRGHHSSSSRGGYPSTKGSAKNSIISA